MNKRPIAPDLFVEGTPPRLIGGRHRTSGRIVFPLPAGSEQELYEPMVLSPHGRLWSYTVQRFQPKSPPYAGPQPFEPFAVGYVELPGEIIVEARITGIPFDQLRINMPLTLTLEPFRTDPDGATVVTYAFGPARETAQ